MIITNDDHIKALLSGKGVGNLSDDEVIALRDALHVLNAAEKLEDTLYAGRRTLRVIVKRQRQYYVDVGSSEWIYFEWRAHDAIKVRLIRLGRTTLGSAFRR
jgi:hypothetical protein